MKICVPIQAKTQKQAKIELEKAAKVADMAEIWLDHIKDLDIADLLKNKPIPVICVCKKPNEKGHFKGADKQLIDILVKAAESGADYVDIPFNLIKNLKFKTKNLKVILSYHNFTKTPSTPTLLKKALEMHKKSADIVKISVMAKSLNDTIRIITLAKILQSKKIPHILIAMGKKGILSRILTPTLGGTIMFAPLKKSKTSAPGQLTVGELRNAWKLIGK